MDKLIHNVPHEKLVVEAGVEKEVRAAMQRHKRARQVQVAACRYFKLSLFLSPLVSATAYTLCYERVNKPDIIVHVK